MFEPGEKNGTFGCRGSDCLMFSKHFPFLQSAFFVVSRRTLSSDSYHTSSWSNLTYIEAQAGLCDQVIIKDLFSIWLALLYVIS